MEERLEDWVAQQWLDESLRIRATLEALEAAERAGVKPEHISTLAYESGVGGIYLKHPERK